MRPIIFSAAILLSAGLHAQDIKDTGSFPTMKEIPAGYFWMGSEGWGHNYDESPVHKVTFTEGFQMSISEITNAQYEAFRPEHKEMRGKGGFSSGDDEAVVQVSYEDAAAYCRWLSEKTGKAYRLPTEAEWEYACRAGTYTRYYSGDWVTGAMEKHQQTERDLVPVCLKVMQSEPNAFGLYDMHGNVEEWCMDWYGPYRAAGQTDPAGPCKGIFRVTRGGSHNTPHDFLRSANRSAAIPSDRHSQIGFRVVISDVGLQHEDIGHKENSRISQRTAKWQTKERKAFWNVPAPYIIRPQDNTPFYRHNHQPAVTWCPNGDLLAIWFSCDAESGREMAVLSSRLRKGSKKWDEAELFFIVPDRNLTGSSLLTLEDGSIMHINGVSNAGDWQNLAMAARISQDNGKTWSAPELIAPEHTKRHQVIAGPIITSDGRIIQCCDAGAGSHDGTAIHISSDGGKTWSDPWDGSSLPEFTDGGTGTTIAGIHAGLVELEDGSLMALGRGNSIIGKDGRKHMPMSISTDGGKTWTYHASELPPVDGGQRLVLKRLAEGPLMLVSFTDHPQRTPEEERGIMFGDRKGYGMYVALSFDEGKTWPVKKLMTDGVERMLDGGAWTSQFIMDETHAEPRGYLACTQSPDGTIHILSSRLHYSFNYQWIME